MRKTKELLRLHFELGLGHRQIARGCGIGVGTVHDYLRRAAAAGISWPLPEGISEEELEARLFPNPVKARPQRPDEPDWKAIHEQLQKHRHLTLQLVWEEYRQSHPDGYGYSWFCERYQRWRQQLDVVLRQDTKPGKRCSWTGQEQRFRFMTRPQENLGLLPCLFLSWDSVPTPMRKRHAISSWKRGSEAMFTRWNFMVVCRNWRCPITPRRR